MSINDNEYQLNRENIKLYLYELAKIYRKLSKGKFKTEIIIAGGASAILNYSFRETSYDIDAITFEESILKEAILKIADKYDLPDDWLNDSFTKSPSYSDKLILHSKYLCNFCNVIDIRTIKGEYLLATKVKAGRIYKHDLSDIIGIIYEERINGNDIDYKMLCDAYVELYGKMDKEKKDSFEFTKRVMEMSDKELQNEYIKVGKSEEENRELLKKIDSEKHIIVPLDKINDLIKNNK